jgi:acetamidase/formamidase
VFEGISVDETGKQHYLDASVAYKRAVLNAVDYLSKFGYTREQIYLLLSCAPSEGRISGPSGLSFAIALTWTRVCLILFWYASVS